MKKSILFLLVVLMTVSLACSLGNDSNPAVSSDDMVATKVAQTLAPQLSNEDVIATNVNATLTAESVGTLSEIDIFATSVAATMAANQVDSKDMEATQPSPPTIEPTVPVFPTNTTMPTVPPPPTLPPVTSTPTNVPTPTLDPNDPAVKYGAPSYTNGLDVESSMLKNFSSGTFEAVFVDGAYQLTTYQT